MISDIQRKRHAASHPLLPRLKLPRPLAVPSHARSSSSATSPAEELGENNDEKVHLDMEKHVSMKEFQLVWLLNTDLANMIATRSYLTFFPSNFLLADTPQIRMFKLIEMNFFFNRG